MRLFIDTGSVAEVEEIAAWGVLSGATTNPSLLAKEEGDPGEAIKRICELVDGDVSAEVVSRDTASMVAEGRALRTLHDNVIVKVPFSATGLEATRILVSEGHKVNMTLVFSATQALLTAEAGASYVSCFMGRLDDISIDSASVVREIVETLRPGGYTAHRGAPRLRGGDGPGQGPQAAAQPPADHRRHRQVRIRLEVAPGVRAMAARPRAGTDHPRVEPATFPI
jgi:TalC/MipB family fructose-6-phosphate aldolase